MQNGEYRDRFGSSGERMSYLYEGLSFNMLAEGRDASGIDTNGGWHSTTSRDFKPTSEYLRTNGRVITRSDVTTEGHSLLDSYTGGYLEKGYYMEDSLGSVMAITNSKGSITESYSYDSFGRLTEGSFDGINRLGYNGKRVDPVTGRSNYEFRDYDFVQMRFTTVDPVKDGLNWYSYVNNDPVNFIDLWGLSASDTQLAQELSQLESELGLSENDIVVSSNITSTEESKILWNQVGLGLVEAIGGILSINQGLGFIGTSTLGSLMGDDTLSPAKACLGSQMVKGGFIATGIGISSVVSGFAGDEFPELPYFMEVFK